MRQRFITRSFGCILAIAAAGGGHAAVLQPDEVSTAVPAGSQDTSSPYSDDILLESLVFGDTAFVGSPSLRSISRFEVITGRAQVNAEWGDLDDGADGDDNPFAKAGFDPAQQETTDAAIQDATLLQAFNTRSLSEMSDGEGGKAFSFRAEFSASLRDNDAGVDDVPELVFFERGLNDVFAVKLIVGGTFENPIFSNTVTMDSGDFFPTGVFVDTVEIDKKQQIGVGGFDLNDFGIAPKTSVYGFELAAATSGPDMNGFFLTAEDPDAYGPGLTPVPLPATMPLLLAAIGGTYAFRRKA